MRLTRRDLIKMSSGAGFAVATAGLAGPLLAQQPMLKTTIPSSGQQVPAVGIGTVDFRGGVNSSSMEGFREVMDIFYQGGGRVVDTSPNYGNAEEILGHITKNLNIRDQLFMATKVDQEEPAAGAQRMESSFEQLGGDVIDLMQVHNLRGTDVQIATMRSWKEQGRFRHIGITTHSSGQYKEFEQAMRKHPLDFIQVNYSIADRGAEQRILPLAEDKGIAILVNRPFGDGRLFQVVRGRALPDWASAIDAESWGQVFLKYIMSHSAATIPIPGTSKPHHARDNVGALYGRLPDAALRREMESFIDALL